MLLEVEKYVQAVLATIYIFYFFYLRKRESHK